MNIRETAELLEEQVLSPYASLSRNSRGRDREEEPCDIRAGLPERSGSDSPQQVVPQTEA